MRLAFLPLSLLATVALADERSVELKKAPGSDVVENSCSVCHSLDYIEMNSPFMSADVWQAEVTKMIKNYGAPIDAANAKVIAQYLVQNYGGANTATSPNAAQQGR